MKIKKAGKLKNPAFKIKSKEKKMLLF